MRSSDEFEKINDGFETRNDARKRVTMDFRGITTCLRSVTMRNDGLKRNKDEFK